MFKKTRKQSLSRSLKNLAFIAVVTWLWSSPAHALDFNIANETDYAATLDAVRAAEYTRQAYIENDDNPRALAAVAGLWVFAERNPEATAEQLTVFVNTLDRVLADVIPGDPRLESFGSVLTALNALRIPSDGALRGTDTRVGAAALERLGLSLGRVDNFEESRLRMTRFDLASVQRLIQRRETLDALTALLAGVTPDGRRMDHLAQAANAYLAARGFDPQLGIIDPALDAINEGLADLPSYAEYLALLDNRAALDALQQTVIGDIDDIQAEGARLLDEIGSPDINLGEFSDAAALSRAAEDPNDPDHAAAIALLEERRQAIIDSTRLTARERSSAFAKTLILQQSNFDDIRILATTTRDFTAVQLQTNNTLAVTGQAVGIAGSVVGVIAAYKTGDVWGGVQSTADIVTGALGLADTLGGGPTTEEQVFEQIVAMRQQIAALGNQLNARFDVVDRKLDTLFTTMTDSFAELGNQIGDLQQDVDNLAVAIAESRSSLDRIEDVLFGFGQELLLAELSQETNLALSYFDSNGITLPYAGDTPSFVASSSFFYTFATSTSRGQSFAGTPDDQPLPLTLDNAAQLLGEDPVARRLNELRRVPAGLETSGGMPYTGPILAGRIPAPAPWAQGAAAYLQLAKENPWYFNYQLGSQIESGAAIRIDEIIGNGERITALAEATRDDDDLFDALLHRTRLNIEDFQAAIDARFASLYPGLQRTVGDNEFRLEPWGPVIQSAYEWTPSEIQVFSQGNGTLALNVDHALYRGHEFTISSTANTDLPDNDPDKLIRALTAPFMSRLHALEVGLDAAPDLLMNVNPGDVCYASCGINDFQVTLKRLTPLSFVATRRLKILLEIFTQGAWRPYENALTQFAGLPGLTDEPRTYYDFIERAWPEFGRDFAKSVLTDSVFDTGEVATEINPASFQITETAPTRIRVFDDSSTLPNAGDLRSHIAEEVFQIRRALRTDLLTELATPGSPLQQAAERLTNDNALLDAYLTLGLSNALENSELLRSATRGAGSIGGLGVRPEDVEALLLYDDVLDAGEDGGPTSFDALDLEAPLKRRLGDLEAEITAARQTDAPSFPYVEYMLNALRSLRAGATTLATDDTYVADGSLIVPAGSGLLRNDIGQPGFIDSEELEVDVAFLDSPEAVRPGNGTLTVSPDGSFSYTPNPGFSGTDRFSYRLRAAIPGITPEVISDPADVVMRISDDGGLIFINSFEN